MILVRSLIPSGLILLLLAAGCASEQSPQTLGEVAARTSEENIAVQRSIASEVLYWIAHPCRDIKGAPYRKYQSFALDDQTGKIYGRTSETGVATEIKERPAGDDNAWKSITDFFASRGVNTYCQAHSGDAKAPVADAGDDVGHGQGSSSHKRSQKARDFEISNAPFTAPIIQDKALYYSPLSLRDDGSRRSMKRKMFDFLSQPHVEMENLADAVNPTCPTELPTGAVCVSPRNMNYKEARQFVFGDIDLRKNDEGKLEVFDYYCQRWVGEAEVHAVAKDKSEDLGPLHIPNAAIMNLEHSFPQSKFVPAKGTAENLIQKTEMHHMFPTDSKVNGLRSNWEFAEVDAGSAQPMHCSDGRLGHPVLTAGVTASSDNTAFEPPTNFKGEVARALLYFSARFNAGMSPLQEAYLRQWSKEHPPTVREMARNDRIFELEGTRNLFVDHPEWIDLVPRYCREKLEATQEATPFDCP